MEIKEYFVNTFSRMNQQKELNRFFEGISPSLRQQIQYQIFHEALEINVVLNQYLSHEGDDHHA